MKDIFKKKYQLLVAFLLGGLTIGSIGVYGSTLLSSNEVFYDNSKGGGSASDVQGSLEELYEKSNKCTTGSCSLTKSNFYVGYTYNQESGSENYCVTGDEATCIRTDCYTSSTKVCPKGTIIDYIVKGTNTRVRFHVIQDNGKSITMQSQKNTTTPSTWGPSGVNKNGPTVALPKLEQATSTWTNVDDQTYIMGTTIFTGDNANSGCVGQSDATILCNTNTYTWESRTTKARLITMQEVESVGCLVKQRSCPIWMYNYLYQSTSYGGTANNNNKDSSSGSYLWGYWTMSALSSSTTYAWFVDRYGYSYYNASNYSGSSPYSTRAVITVRK